MYTVDANNKDNDTSDVEEDIPVMIRIITIIILTADQQREKTQTQASYLSVYLTHLFTKYACLSYKRDCSIHESKLLRYENSSARFVAR